MLTNILPMKITRLFITLFTFILTTTIVLANDPVVITQWTFDETLEPAVGTGTATLLGGTSTHSTTLSNGWRITDFPNQFEGSGTAGAEFMVSTVGYNTISVTFGHRSSGTMSRWAEIHYTTDGGTTWNVLGNNEGGLSPHDTVFDFSFDLSSIPAANNNPNFGFRVVSIFSPVEFNPEVPDEVFAANTAYHRARTQGTGGGEYSGEGNWRLLNVTVQSGADEVEDPEPFTLWTFDETLDPEVGSGTASLLGGTTTHSTTLGNGWRITDFPDQFVGSGTAGAEFMVSTLGYEDIKVTFGHRSSGTMSRWAEFHYTIDGGTNWNVFGNNNGGLTPHDTVFDFELDFTGVEGVSNNEDFGIRIVSIFSPVEFNPEEPDEVFAANTAYHRARTEGSGGGNDYSGEGNWRLLNVAFFGEELPDTHLEPQSDLPAFVTLHQNYPNPFNPTTQIRFDLHQATDVRIEVFNSLGQRVATVVNGAFQAGTHTASFNAAHLTSGVYLYRLQAGDIALTRKMLLVK